MANENSTPDAAEAPWATKRNLQGKHLLRRSLPWLGAAALISFIVWGLWPKPIVIEAGVVAKSPLTVFVSEEGKTRVRNRYVVATTVAGKMRRIPLKPGDAVTAESTILTSIEPVVAPLLDPRARLQAEALVSMQEAAQKKAKESLDATRTALQRAESERSRIANVKSAGMISISDRERIEAEASIKAAEVRAMEFALQISDYELAQARAALMRPTVDATGNVVEVKSPVSGVVLKVMQESETVVTPGMGLLEIGDPNDLEIEAEILSRDAVSIKVGDAVSIEQWGSAQSLKGRVRRVEPAAFTKISALGVEEQRVIVLIDLVDPPAVAKSLGDRYRIEARIAIWQADDVLVVPASALFREGNTWKTYRFEQGKAHLTTIEVGHTDGRLSEVISGLKEGDRVLLHPPDSVKDQSTVTERAQ